MKPRLVKVVWDDACLEWSVKKGEAAELERVETVGWLIHETETLVNVAQEDAGAEWRAVTVIPRSCIVDIVPCRQRR